MSQDVFIAYDRDDSEAARQVQEYLTDAGFECYRDVTHIPLSAEWVTAITAAIRECHACIILVSEQSIGSEPVHQEMRFAQRFPKRFVPVLLSRDVQPSEEMVFFFGNIHYAYADPSLETALPQIASAVARVVDRSKHRVAYDDEAGVRGRANFHRETAFGKDSLGLFTGEDSCGVTTFERDA